MAKHNKAKVCLIINNISLIVQIIFLLSSIIIEIYGMSNGNKNDDHKMNSICILIMYISTIMNFIITVTTSSIFLKMKRNRFMLASSLLSFFSFMFFTIFLILHETAIQGEDWSTIILILIIAEFIFSVLNIACTFFNAKIIRESGLIVHFTRKHHEKRIHKDHYWYE